MVASSSQQWMGKNYHIRQIQTESKNTMYKKLAKNEPQKVRLKQKKERPGGSKTLKGDPGKN